MAGTRTRVAALLAALVALVAPALVALAAAAAVYPTTGAGSSPRVQVSFVAGGATVSRQIVRAGDTLVAPAPPAAEQDDAVFAAWSAGGTDLAPYLDAALSQGAVASLAALGSDAGDGLSAVVAEATFAPAATLRLHQYPYAQSAADPALDAVACYTMRCPGSASLEAASRAFVPVVEGFDAELVAWERYADGASADADPQASYDPRGDIEGVTSDMDLYPRLSGGFWVTLATGDGAPELESIFVADGGTGQGTMQLAQLPTEATLAGDAYDPETGAFADSYRGWNLGWTLEGWYEDEALEHKVTDDMLLSSGITLHAHWVPRNDTPYTVINMVEGPEGGPGEGTYTRYSAVTFEGTTGALVPDSAYASLVPHGSTVVKSDYYTFPVDFGYHLPAADELGEGYANNATEVVIDGAGNSVKYVYWNRNRTKVTVKQSSSVSHDLTFYGMDARYGGYVKTGEAWEVWDPTGAVMRALDPTWTYPEGDYYKLWYYGFSGSQFWQGGFAIDVPGTTDKQSITYEPYTRNLRNSFIMTFYVDALEGDESHETQDVTIGGSTHKVYAYESYENYTSRTDNPLNGYGAYAASAFDGGASLAAVHDRSGIVARTESQADVLPMYKGADDRWHYDVFYLRNSFNVSFGNVSGVLGDYALDSSSMKYGAALSDVDPGFGTGTRRLVGNVLYDFTGWYDNAFFANNPAAPGAEESRVNLASATMPAGDYVLYASWTPTTYDVTFDAEGGQLAPAAGATLSDDKSQLTYTNVDSGSRIVKPATPVKVVNGVEYTFVGWYRDEALTKAWDFASATVQGPTTLHAKWVKGRVYGVTYHEADGAVIDGADAGRYRYGASVDVVPAPEGGTGAPFLGWSLVRGNASYVVGQSFTISSNTDLFAVYGDAMPGAGTGDVEAGAPVLTLDSNYPEGVAGRVRQELQVSRANDAVTLPGALAGASAVGYHVAGWATESGGSAAYAVGARVAVAADSTLYAVWEANQLSAALDASFTYDGAAHRPAPTVAGWDGAPLAEGADYALSYDADATSAGEHRLTVTGAGDYALSAPVTLSYDVARRPVTLAAGNASSRMGDPLAEVTWTMSGTLAAPGDLGTIAGTTDAVASAVGDYSTGVSFSSNANYDVTVVPGSYRVTAASLAVAARGWSGAYDGASHSASVALAPAEAVAGGARVYYSATTPLTADNYATAGTDPAPSRTDAGTSSAYYYVEGTGSYQPDDSERAGTVSVTVAPAPLTVRANDVSVTYGDAAGGAGVSAVGLAGGDTVESLGLGGLAYSLQAADGTPYEPGSPAGTYRVVPSGLSWPNYDVSYAPGTLSVGRLPLELSWSAADSMPYTGSPRTYAGATAANALAGDDVSLGVAGATATRAGSYSATVTGLSGARASSYALPAEGLSHPWEITQADNSATVAIDDWTYGGARALPTCVAGFGAETASFEYAAAAAGPFSAEAPEHAGTWWVRAVVGGTDDYAAATSEPVAYEVARATLTVTASDATVAYGDEPTGAGYSLSGLVAGDEPGDVEIVGEVRYLFGASAGSPVGEYWVEPDLSGASAADYDLMPARGRLTVTRADNSWAEPPSVADWVAGATPAAPTGRARFGEVAFAYRTAGDVSAAWSSLPPTAPGGYEMRAAVAGTDNFGPIEATVSFEVKPARVTFDANSRLATGSVVDATGSVGDPVEVPACGYSWADHVFLGWNTAADGSGSAYTPGDPYEIASAHDTLYAQWDPRGELAYDGNGATSGATPAQSGSAGEAVTVAACGFAREGFDFAGWSTEADGTGRTYQPGDALELSLGGDVFYAQWRERSLPASKRPMYRLYNPNSGEHFYTASADERDAVAAAGWRYEGLGWVAPASGEPVYRLYNAYAGDHHYTLSAEERDALVSVGWRYEGVGWRSADHGSGVPLWREYNPNALAGAHNFTADEREHLSLCALGWRGEGIAWYGVR